MSEEEVQGIAPEQQVETEEVSRETEPVMERPEIIPEKFWNAEAGEINLEDMAKSYAHLEKCFEGGASQEEFEDGVNQYIDTMMSNQPDLNAEVEKLGENSTDRLNAVNAWASSFFPPEEYETIAGTLGQTAQGIAALERMQESMNSSNVRSEAVAQPERELGVNDVKEMMNDKRYYDQRHRDKEYVNRVDQAWARLNMAGKV